jgi:hypothetical protein
MGEERLGLKEAGKLLGLSANGVRARASAGKIRYEIDNARKWWVFLDPETIANDTSKMRVPETSNLTSNFDPKTLDFEPERAALKAHIGSLSAALEAMNAEVDRLRVEAGEGVNLRTRFAALEARHGGAMEEIARLREQVAGLDAERQKLVADMLARLPVPAPQEATDRGSWLHRLFGRGRG